MFFVTLANEAELSAALKTEVCRENLFFFFWGGNDHVFNQATPIHSSSDTMSVFYFYHNVNYKDKDKAKAVSNNSIYFLFSTGCL